MIAQIAFDSLLIQLRNAHG